VNRVGDFGMIIGLLAIWSSLGTFSFGDSASGTPGLFSLVRPAATHHALVVPDGMIQFAAREEIAQVVAQQDDRSLPAIQNAARQHVEKLRGEAEHGGPRIGYWLLVVGGIGIFCGCVGKSAQFPLHVWLPDAMEGPTPVSALVHSATMVAAGVYLVGRFYPVFVPEVLLVIAAVGCITLFIAATIAITAVDIKRVLAYSTVSQLGYMMLALGVGGWRAGLMHLITHAFFKSLLFMCSGSVIHAVHTNDMRQMGGLLTKMPVTAITMLIGCLAIAGVGLPFVIGFSGYYSKDAILEQAYSLYLTNGTAWSGVFFVAAAGGAAITAFYMFRMWYLTFVGVPRNAERYDHAHESPAVMTLPLVVLSVFAIAVAWDFSLIGYALVAGGFFLAKGIADGWFRAAAGHGADHAHHDPHDHGHGHDHEHAHPAAQHHDHPHDEHTHDKHDDHQHASSHGHASHAHHVPSPVFSTAWVAVMLISSLVGGRLVQSILTSESVASTSLVKGAMGLSLANLLEQARPLGTAADAQGYWLAWTWPDEHKAHAPHIVVPVTLLATGTWIFGIGLATLMYATNVLNPEEVRRQFSAIYSLLWNKWWFDELYDALFVQPSHVLGRFIASIDRDWIDGLLHALAACVLGIARVWERVGDRTLIDGSINLGADWIYSFALQLRLVQTGRLRQYVMFIVVGALAVFILVSFFWTPAIAR
jgi:NADH-quinone oxidoreductase subunit L